MKRRAAIPRPERTSRNGVQWSDNPGLSRYRALSQKWVSENQNVPDDQRKRALHALAQECCCINEVAPEIYGYAKG